MKNRNSIKTRLFIWYGGSLLLIALFFWFGVHTLSIPYGTEIFIGLLLILSLVGFFIIQTITNSLINLTKRIQTISTKNLNERIETDVKNDEIASLSKSFNDLMDRIEDSFKRERQFIGDVAHELKTPIATLRSSIEVALTRTRTNSEYRQILKDSLEDINNMTTTLIDVLDLAWIEANIDKKFSKKLNLSDLLEELVEIGTKLGEINKVKITSDIEKNITIYGEREKLARSFLNLLDNAIKYNKRNGKVDISLKKEGESYVVKIYDSGIGIPKADINHIFDRFYRGGRSQNIGGSGLGLAIAKSIIQLHHGKITVRSKLKKGTTFTVFLPST